MAHDDHAAVLSCCLFFLAVCIPCTSAIKSPGVINFRPSRWRRGFLKEAYFISNVSKTLACKPIFCMSVEFLTENTTYKTSSLNQAIYHNNTKLQVYISVSKLANITNSRENARNLFKLCGIHRVYNIHSAEFSARFSLGRLQRISKGYIP